MEKEHRKVLRFERDEDLAKAAVLYGPNHKKTQRIAEIEIEEPLPGLEKPKPPKKWEPM